MSARVALVLVFVVALGSSVSADEVGTVHCTTSCGAEARAVVPPRGGVGHGARGTDGSAGRSASTVSRGDLRTEAQR